MLVGFVVYVWFGLVLFGGLCCGDLFGLSICGLIVLICVPCLMLVLLVGLFLLVVCSLLFGWWLFGVRFDYGVWVFGVVVALLAC